MLMDEIKNIVASRREIRKFAVVIGCVCCLISGAYYLNGRDGYVWFLTFGMLFAFVGMCVPVILHPLYKTWMIFAVVMGWISTRVILLLLYYLVLTPVSLLSRLIGKRYLDLSKNANNSSYWHLREKMPKSGIDAYERQF